MYLEVKLNISNGRLSAAGTNLKTFYCLPPQNGPLSVRNGNGGIRNDDSYDRQKLIEG